MRILSSHDIPAFIMEKAAAVLHFDTEWDGELRELTRKSMLEAEAVLRNVASFAEIVCDANAEFSRSIPVLNVPLVA